MDLLDCLKIVDEALLVDCIFVYLSRPQSFTITSQNKTQLYSHFFAQNDVIFATILDLEEKKLFSF